MVFYLCKVLFSSEGVSSLFRFFFKKILNYFYFFCFVHKVYVEDHIDVGFGDSIVLANEGGVSMVFM